MNILKKEFHFFFGEDPKVFDIISVNIFSIAIGFVLAFMVPVIRDNTSMVQKIVLILMAWDIFGGAIANLTRSTNTFYATNKKMRYIFYSLHFSQPLIMYFFFNGGFLFFLFIWLFPVISIIVLIEVIKDEYRNTLAGILWVSGIVVLVYFLNVPVILCWFGIAFLTKLIISYGVDHFPGAV